jgi:lysophospholipase L1-like esterase
MRSSFRPRLNHSALVALAVLGFLASPGVADQQHRERILRESRTIVFLGDSITFGGGYVAYFDAWLLTEKLDPAPRIINAGLASETVSGLSEEGHADGRFPRPDLAERLGRVLALTRPDLVFACYGINCGIYEPLDEERFRHYRQGIEQLKRQVEAAGATLVLVTPPSYDDQRKRGSFSYNAVLDHYADWLLAWRTDGWLVVDLHGPMTVELARRRQVDPDFTFQPDAVHPNDEGHWFMARQLIRWFGDAEAAGADSPEAMLEARGFSPDAMKLVRQRMAVLRDAYVTAAGHKRPGVRAGLPVPDALEKAQELSGQILELAR